MFFEKPPVLIYIRRNSIELYFEKGMEKIEFPAEILVNNEILDEEKYNKLVSEFIARFNLQAPKALIVLSDEIIFQKSFPLVEADQLNILMQKFNDTIPFDSEKIASKHILTGDELVVFATNKRLYGLIEQKISELRWKVLAVVPLTVFKEKLQMEDEELNGDLAKKILAHKQLIALSNFLNYEEISLRGKKARSLPALVLVAVMLLLLLTALLSAYFLGYLKFPLIQTAKKATQTAKVDQTVKKAQESTAAAKEKEASFSAQIKKEDLKIEILNGTGLAGQAAKVRDQLLKLGYKNFELGNAEGAGATETVVVFSKKVSDEIEAEIVEELKKSFVRVSKQEKSELEEFDILITTGKNI